MKIAIVGKEADTLNYVRYVQSVGAMPLVTLNPETAAACDALLLPGEGTSRPHFSGRQITAHEILIRSWISSSCSPWIWQSEPDSLCWASAKASRSSTSSSAAP